jgi:hypothetical protein
LIRSLARGIAELRVPRLDPVLYAALLCASAAPLTLGLRSINGRSMMKDAGLVCSGFVFGWLMSKTWSDPGCQMGLVIFLVATAVMFLAFVLVVVGHGRASGRSDRDDDED